MENFINEESIKIFHNKLFTLLNNTFPGIFTLEVFFKKGIFSNTPQSIYDFILLILWAFIFSIPFNLFDTFSLKSFYHKLKTEVSKSVEFDEEREKDFSEYLSENSDYFDKGDALIQFLFIIIYLTSTYLIFHFLTYFYQFESFWSINPQVIIYGYCLTLFYLGPFPIIFLATRLIEKIYLKKEAKNYINI